MMISVKALFLRSIVFLAALNVLSNPSFSYDRQDYQVTNDKGVAASMRDGVKLYSNVYRPKAQGKFPVILIRTPYGKDRFEKTSSFLRCAVQRGYVVISRTSGGAILPKENSFLMFKRSTTAMIPLNGPPPCPIPMGR